MIFGIRISPNKLHSGVLFRPTKVCFVATKVRFLATKVCFLATKVCFLATKVCFLATKVRFLATKVKSFRSFLCVFQGATLFQYDGFSQACLVFKPHVFGFVMLFADKKRDA